MSVDYYVRLVVGVRMDLEHFFVQTEGVTSCSHAPTTAFCPVCGAETKRGTLEYAPTPVAKELFGPDVEFDNLCESDTPDPGYLQMVNVALTYDDPPSWVCGLQLAATSIEGDGQCPLVVLMSKVQETSNFITAMLKAVKLGGSVEVFIAPRVSY